MTVYHKRKIILEYLKWFHELSNSEFYNLRRAITTKKWNEDHEELYLFLNNKFDVTDIRYLSIQWMFIWEDTPEGDSYWRHIFDRLKSQDTNSLRMRYNLYRLENNYETKHNK